MSDWITKPESDPYASPSPREWMSRELMWGTWPDPDPPVYAVMRTPTLEEAMTDFHRLHDGEWPDHITLPHETVEQDGWEVPVFLIEHERPNGRTTFGWPWNKAFKRKGSR